MLTIMVNIIDIIWSQEELLNRPTAWFILLRTHGILLAKCWRYKNHCNPNPFPFFLYSSRWPLRLLYMVFMVVVSSPMFQLPRVLG